MVAPPYGLGPTAGALAYGNGVARTPGNQPIPVTGGAVPANGGPGRGTVGQPVTLPNGRVVNPGEPGYQGALNLAYPQQASRAYMKSHGMNPDSNMPFGDFIRKFYNTVVPLLLKTTTDQSGAPALDQAADLNTLLDPILYGGAGTLGANLIGHADKVQGALTGSMGGMDPDIQKDLLRALLGLRSLPANPYLSNAMNNRTENAINASDDYAFGLAQQGGTVPGEWNLGDWILHQLPLGMVNPFPVR